MVAALGIGLFMAACDPISIGMQTEYAPNYSERRFKELTNGMEEKQVVSLLGPPFSKRTQQWSEVWFYSPPGSQPTCVTNRSGSITFNMFGPVSYIRFSESGIVVSTSGDYVVSTNSLVGLTREKILEKIGAPGQRELKRCETIYNYSRSSGNGSYKRREVHFDKGGNLTNVVAENYYD
jgi:hypothetical protein